MPSSANRTKSRKKCFLAALAFLAVFFALITGVSLGFYFFMQDRLHVGVSIAGMRVDGKTMDDARQILEKSIVTSAEHITLETAGARYDTDAAELGISVFIDETLENAYARGHGDGFWKDLVEALGLLGSSQNIPLEVRVDDTLLNAALSRRFEGTLVHRAVNAKVLRRGESFSVEDAHEGTRVDREALANILRNRIQRLDREPVPLTVQPDLPVFTTEDAHEFLRALNQTLAQSPYFLFAASRRFLIPRSLVADWVELAGTSGRGSPFWNKESIRQYLISIAPAAAEEPRNVEVGASSSGIMQIAQPSQDSIQLDVEKTTLALMNALETQRRVVTAALVRTPAKVNEILLKNLGVTALLGRGESDFAGSPKSRAHNIRVGAERYRGIMLLPGEEFSFDKVLGDIGPETGYLPELVIKGKKLIPEYGGGICQVSTTLFRAAVYAGMRITERNAHSLPVRYYAPQGFDATIYPPSPDLKFVNTASSTVLIQPRIEGTKLAFEIYGTPQTRTVAVEGPKVIESSPDGSMKTVVTQKILENGKVVYQKSFWSFYKSPSLFAVERNPLE